jgi:PilZ domain
MQNDRHTPRAPIIAAVQVTEAGSGARLSARTSDMSRTGCYIDTLNSIAAGTVVRLQFTHGGEELDVPAKIVYVSPHLGMGVHFEPLTPAQLAILDRWLSGAK